MANYQALVGAGIFLVIWLVLFLYRKKFRKEMLIMGLLVAPLGPLSKLFYSREYWDPSYLFTFFGIGLEEVLLGFFIGGIAAVIYEKLFIKKFERTKKEPGYNMIILAITGLALFIVLNLFFKISSVYASSIGFIAIGSIILIKRRDLIKNAIMSGVLVSLVLFIFYLIYMAIYPNIILDWFQLEKISGILILGIPLEELIWGFSWGFLVGPFYEFWQGKRGIELK